jgi:hypothetical protein
VSPSVPNRKAKRSKKSAYLPDSMWAELEQIAEQETEKRKGTPDEDEISVNWLMEVFLGWAIDDYRKLQTAQPAPVQRKKS